MRRIVMSRHGRPLPVLLVAAVALVLGTAAPDLRAAGGEVKGQIPFADARIFIELNATDRDVGLQVVLDAEAWRTVTIVGPDGRRIFEARGKGTLRRQGLTELRFESEEPSLEDLPLDEFLARFPEGQYEFLGTTVEGDELMGTASLTHCIPEGPPVFSPEEGAEVDPDNTVIRWASPATFLGSCPAGLVIAGYQVTVEREDPLRELSVTLPASATSVTVPPEFLEPGTEYAFEVLAIEAGGNQTITLGAFVTE